MSEESQNHICLREQIEERERVTLSPFAALSANTLGRKVPKPLDPYRTEFQRDRERIIHCKAFRRLSHKTQVFLAPEGDHYRTRLTHTLEVAQIARSIARTLALNEDLTEAIALGHDLGHTPFGHTGETAITNALQQIEEKFPGRFRNYPLVYEHVKQSLRMVDTLEYDGKGLNLCFETRDGIHGHSGRHLPKTLEGQVVRIADRIAYINHDIDDAIRAHVIKEEELPEQYTIVLGDSSPARITTMVKDLIKTSAGKQEIRMSEEVHQAVVGLRNWMFDHVYMSKVAKKEEPKAQNVIESLFFYYLEHLEELPSEYGNYKEGGEVQAVIDFVAGMTDRYALRQFDKLFVPSAWRV